MLSPPPLLGTLSSRSRTCIPMGISDTAYGHMRCHWAQAMLWHGFHLTLHASESQRSSANVGLLGTNGD